MENLHKNGASNLNKPWKQQVYDHLPPISKKEKEKDR